VLKRKKLFFHEVKMKTFPDKQKLKEFVANRPTLQENTKVPGASGSCL
jgi:hypothetical protein